MAPILLRVYESYTSILSMMMELCPIVDLTYAAWVVLSECSNAHKFQVYLTWKPPPNGTCGINNSLVTPNLSRTSVELPVQHCRWRGFVPVKRGG